jgi:anti-sigma-K factor RskA
MSAGAHSNDDNALAGEYVLGVLPADMRRQVEQRLAVDPDFAALVGSWQSDLSALDDAYTPETPPRGIKARIEAQLFAGAPGAAQPAGGLWASLAFWRGLTVAAIATSLGLAAFTFVVNERPSDPAAAPALVAELGAPGSSVGLVAALDPASGALQVTPAAFSPEDARALELWLVPGEGAPVSLGLVPGDGGQLVLDESIKNRLSAGALLAVSVEPEGGSPTGAPTGPVVLSGALAEN